MVDGQNAGRAPRSSASSDARRRVIRTLFVTALILLALFYGGRVLLLWMGATEGDVPSASVLPLPDGAQVLGQSVGCGSGGCAVTFTVRPPAGQSAEDLAEEMRTTPQRTIPGNLWDPRTVWVSARPVGGVLNLTADYWSGPWGP